MKKIALALAVVSTLLMMLSAVGTSATAESQGKVFVCKYVGTPGVNEVLQGGGNPISTSVNSIPIYDPNNPALDTAAELVGQEFADAQGQSVVIAEDVGQEEPSPEDCPVRTPPTTTTPPPTTTVPPTTTTPPPTTTQPPTVHACPGSVRFGPWYGDPRVNIFLTGEGTFVIKGGIQRFTGRRVITVALACNATYTVSRYKVHTGKAVRVYLDGVLIATNVAVATH